MAADQSVQPAQGAVDPVKPGYTTTEFYVTIITALLPAITFIFHKDFSSQVQSIAAAAAGVAAAVYALSRAFTKSANSKAQSTASSLPPGGPPPPTGVNGNGSTGGMTPVVVVESDGTLASRLLAIAPPGKATGQAANTAQASDEVRQALANISTQVRQVNQSFEALNAVLSVSAH